MNRRVLILTLALSVVMLIVFFHDLFFGSAAIFKDQAYEFHYQAAEYLKQQWASGEFPLWNRRAAMGEPFAAYPEYSLFYPLFIPLTMMIPSWVAINILILLQYLIIAGATALLARKLGQSIFGCAIAGLSFAFNGYLLMLYSELQSLTALAALPVALIFAESFRETKQWRYVVAAAAALGIGHLGGGVQYSYYVDTLFGLWCLFPFENRSPKAYVRWIGFGAAALVLSVLLAAIMLYPASEMAEQSARSEIDYDQAAHSPKGDETWGHEIGARDLCGFVLPSMDPVQKKPIHIGFIALILLGFGVLSMDRRRGFLVAIALIAFLVALGRHTPAFRLFYELPIPGMGMFKNPIRIITLTLFCIALLAGFGADKVIALFSESRRFVAGVSLALAMLLSLTPALGVIDLLPMPQVRLRIEQTDITEAIHKATKVPARTFAYHAARSFEKYNEYDYVENTGMAQGIDLVDGNSSLHSQRYLTFTAAGDDVSAIRQYADDKFFQYNALRTMANVAFVVSAGDGSVPLSYRELARGIHNAVYAVAEPKPVWISSKWLCAGSEAESRRRLGMVRDIAELVDVIEDPTCAPGTLSTGTARFLSRTADRIEIEIDTDRPAWLVISESYDPSWKAFAGHDRQEKPLVPANLAFMAVPIDSGKYMMRLEYRPQSFGRGAATSAATLAFCIVIFGVAVIRDWTRRKPS